jgi:hypothetical protein
MSQFLAVGVGDVDPARGGGLRGKSAAVDALHGVLDPLAPALGHLDILSDVPDHLGAQGVLVHCKVVHRAAADPFPQFAELAATQHLGNNGHRDALAALLDVDRPGQTPDHTEYGVGGLCSGGFGDDPLEAGIAGLDGTAQAVLHLAPCP